MVAFKFRALSSLQRPHNVGVVIAGKLGLADLQHR